MGTGSSTYYAKRGSGDKMNCRFTGSIADGAETCIRESEQKWKVIPPPMLWVKPGGNGPFGLQANPNGDGSEYRLVGKSADGYHNYVAPTMLDADQLAMSTQDDSDVVY